MKATHQYLWRLKNNNFVDRFREEIDWSTRLDGRKPEPYNMQWNGHIPNQKNWDDERYITEPKEVFFNPKNYELTHKGKVIGKMLIMDNSGWIDCDFDKHNLKGCTIKLLE